MNPAAPDRDRKAQILRTAAEVLENKSFSAFSYQDLADRLDIRKASIHHHFPTKDDLGRALIDHYRENGDRIMSEILGGASSPGDAMRRMLEASERVLLDSPDRVCPTGAFEVDGAALSDSMRAALEELRQNHLDRVAEMLAGARAAGEISFLGDAQDQSALIMAAMQGAQEAVPIVGREFFRRVIRQIQRGLGL